MILDYQMPEMNGELVAAEMRKTNPRVPILMFSGCVSPPESALQLVDEFIAKGDPVEFLLLTVQQLLSRGAVIHSRVATERVAPPYGTKLRGGAKEMPQPIRQHGTGHHRLRR